MREFAYTFLLQELNIANDQHLNYEAYKLTAGTPNVNGNKPTWALSFLQWRKYNKSCLVKTGIQEGVYRFAKHYKYNHKHTHFQSICIEIAP